MRTCAIRVETGTRGPSQSFRLRAQQPHRPFGTGAAAAAGAHAPTPAVAPSAVDPFTFSSHACSYTRGDACDPAAYARLFARSSTSGPAAAEVPADSSAGAGQPRRIVDLLLTDPPYCLLTPRSSSGRTSRGASSRKKLSWDASGAVQRFDSLRAYRDFTRNWLRAASAWVKADTGVIVVWTNFLGKRPIQEAMGDVLPGYRQWNELVWLKPSRPEETREKKATIQHSITPPPPPSPPSASASSATSDSSIRLSPSGRATLPPLASLSLTSPEQLYRAYEVALVFGPGEWRDSSWAKESPGQEQVQSVVCPFEESDSLHDHHDEVSRLAASTHPNAKPPRVLLPLLSSYSRLGSLVLDPFAGSSAHARTAMRAGRRVATIELTEQWARTMKEQMRARCPCAAAATTPGGQQERRSECTDCIAKVCP